MNILLYLHNVWNLQRTVGFYFLIISKNQRTASPDCFKSLNEPRDFLERIGNELAGYLIYLFLKKYREPWLHTGIGSLIWRTTGINPKDCPDNRWGLFLCLITARQVKPSWLNFDTKSCVQKPLHC